MKGEAQDKQPILLGAVDLGSNSFRVEIGRVEDYRITTESYWKETVRLAGGIDEHGAFTPEIQERALSALRRFREKLEGIDPQNIRAVGTQALRVATNSADFLPRAEEALGHPIEIIAGREEARLVFSGCAHTLPPSSEKRLVVDIGGGTADIAVISLSGVVESASIKIAGDQLNEAVVKYMRRKHNLLVGERTAEEMKKQIGCVFPKDEEETMDVKGRCLLTGLPKVVTVSSTEMMDAFEEPVERIMEAIHSVLERTPPELVADVSTNGIIMTGGGSLVYGFDKLVTARTGIHTTVADDAISCVVLGTGKSLDSLNAMQDGTMNLSRRKQMT